MPDPVQETVSDDMAGPWRRPLVTIFWISVLGLFIELLLIRWISTEIRIFAYLQNTVLVVCFLGLGAGLFTSRRRVVPWHSIGAVVALVLLLAAPGSGEWLRAISDRLSVLGDLSIWYEAIAEEPRTALIDVGLGLLSTLLVMGLLAEVFVPIGRLLGRLLDAAPRPILAYSVNVAGSLIGTWLFVGMSTLEWPPAVWFACAAVLFTPFLAVGGSTRRLGALLLVALVLGGWLGGRGAGIETVWSPYQKLVLVDGRSEVPGYPGDRFELEVNNVGYQQLADLRPETLRRTASFPEQSIGFTQYDLPLLLHPDPEDVLIVGAGAGNDAAGALRAGVERITAVEIDPAIIRFGRTYHPEHPYDSPRVRIVNDDARSFFATTAERYDVVVFGLLDSHTTTAMTNARLDHYVYTREAIERAGQLLRDGGIVFLSFEAWKPFLADRMGRVLREVFGGEPIVFRVPRHELSWGGMVFVAGDLATARAQIEANEHLEELIAGWRERAPIELPYVTPVATDDWPYLYLPERRVPLLYLLLAGLLGVLVLYMRIRLGETRAMSPRRWDTGGWHFFFLGTAFLLLEVQNISKAAVVLGNTWQVNAVIISGVLVMILVANGIVSWRPRLPVRSVYGALLVTALGLYFVDLARFAHLPYTTKAVLVGGLTTLPMLFSGIVFARSFAVAERKDRAMGANLLGAMTGAVLQSASFVGGIRMLLLFVAVFYALAMLTRPRLAAAAIARGRDRQEGKPVLSPG